MKRSIITLIIMCSFFYSGRLNSECVHCKRYRDELRKADEFSMKVIRELRATIKELSNASSMIRKLQASF